MFFSSTSRNLAISLPSSLCTLVFYSERGFGDKIRFATFLESRPVRVAKSIRRDGEPCFDSVNLFRAFLLNDRTSCNS